MSNSNPLPLPADALAHYNAGSRCFSERNLPAALRHFQAALKLAGEHPAILEALAKVAEAGGDTASAATILQHLLGRWPSPRLGEWRARVLYRRQQYRETVAELERWLPAQAFAADTLGIYSSALEMCGDYARSRQVREDLFAHAPDAANAADLATMYMRHADYTALDACLPSLLARFPDNVGIAGAAAVWYLGSGDYPRGLANLRRRQQLLGVVHHDPRVAACPAWDGRRFDGTLLASLEPMLGDEVLMTSLLPALVRLGQATVVEVDARCLALYRRSFPAIAFVTRESRQLGERAAAGGNCRHALVIDLLEGLLRRWTLPGTPGWLQPSPALLRDKQAEYRARWPGKRLVGISWRSRQHFNGVDAKSAALADFPLTLAGPDTVFVNLQYGDVQAELDALPEAGRPWRDPAIDTFNDIEGLAAQIAALDQVVTVSNVTAHIAGALGVPTTVLLPKRFPVLWHWGFLGEETTWYGSVRLLRNPRDGDWGEVDALLAADLAGPRRHAGPDSRLSQEIR